MRFSNFFISYKIGLKNIKSTIPFTKLPLYRKIFIILVFVLGVLGMLFAFFYCTTVSLLFSISLCVCVILSLVIDSTKKNQDEMLKKHYAPYSAERMSMVCDLLEQYNLKTTDFEKIDLLIEEAKSAQTQCDYYDTLKKPLKTLSAIIIPIVAYFAQKVGDSASSNELIPLLIPILVIIICCYAILFALAPIVKSIVNRDYNKYSQLISDLTQIKIFY